MPRTAQTISSIAVTDLVDSEQKAVSSNAIKDDSARTIHLKEKPSKNIGSKKTAPEGKSKGVRRTAKVALKSSHKSSTNDLSEDDKKYQAPNNLKLDSVLSDLSLLSKSFVNSYQNLEGEVKQLNGQLLNASEQRTEAIEEKQKLIDENVAITARLQNLLATMPSGVVVLDGKGVVSDCNAVAIDILGRPLLGEHWLEVINRAFLPQADDGHQISLKDGRKIHLETKALDSEPGQMIVLTDMTKTRELQSKLSQQQKLSSMGKMIASLAHQIRTPLSAAILYGSHLDSQKLGEEKQSAFTGYLMERLRFMDRQISDMLNFVKGERKEKQIGTVRQLVERINDLIASFEHKIQISLPSDSVLEKNFLSDMDSLVGAIGNLISNGIDASIDKKPIELILSAHNAGQLSIEVKDSGSGISGEFKSKIFEPFFSTKNNGNGLGLAIVHGVVIEHNGNIFVESDGTNGSSFHIQIPLFAEEKLIPTRKQKHRRQINAI